MGRLTIFANLLMMMMMPLYYETLKGELREPTAMLRASSPSLS